MFHGKRLTVTIKTINFDARQMQRGERCKLGKFMIHKANRIKQPAAQVKLEGGTPAMI